MAKLDLDWLGVFVEVYKTQSVSRAAQRLGMAQASASIALNKLRRHFDDRLFSRTSHGMEPTPRAQQHLSGAARGAVAHREGARHARARSRRPTRSAQFRICMTDISEIVLLPTLLNHLQRVGAGAGRRGREDLARQPAPARVRRGRSRGRLHAATSRRASTSRRCSQQNFVCLAAAEHPRVRAQARAGARSRPKATSSSAPPAPATPSSTRCWRRHKARAPRRAAGAQLPRRRAHRRADRAARHRAARCSARRWRRRSASSCSSRRCRCRPTRSSSIGTSASMPMPGTSGCAGRWPSCSRGMGWMRDPLSGPPRRRTCRTPACAATGSPVPCETWRARTR